MKTILKRFWLASGFVIKALMSIMSVLLFSSRKIAWRLKVLSKEVDTQKKIFVLGNGPSLKGALNTPKLRQEIESGEVIVTNRFAVSDDFNKLKPRYYILMDPKFFEEEFIKTDPSVKVMYDAMNRVDWPLTLFLIKGANLKVVHRYLTNTNIQVELFNGTTIIGPKCFQNFMFRTWMGLPSSRNIIIPAILMMINLGYKKIYLYGAEFSWTKNIDVNPQHNRVFLNNGHFYKESDIIYNEKGWY